MRKNVTVRKGFDAKNVKRGLTHSLTHTYTRARTHTHSLCEMWEKILCVRETGVRNDRHCLLWPLSVTETSFCGADKLTSSFWPA
jgi:hypothetical protein